MLAAAGVSTDVTVNIRLTASIQVTGGGQFAAPPHTSCEVIEVVVAAVTRGH